MDSTKIPGLRDKIVKDIFDITVTNGDATPYFQQVDDTFDKEKFDGRMVWI